VKKQIIFDMDGTLIDSSAIIANSINHVRSRLGLPPMDPATILRAVNDPSIHRPRFFYGTEDYRPEHVEWFRDYYTRHHHAQTRLYPGIRELLEELAPRYDLALATNAYRASAEQILRHTGIAHYFGCIVCGDETEPKPSPKMLERIMERRGVKPSEAVMVGDGRTDEEAAKNAGVDFIRVDWGWEEHPDAVQSVAELRRRLLGA